MRPKGLRTWIELSEQNLAHNIGVFRRLAGDKKLMAVVKSNAYGHGLSEFSQHLEKLGIDWLGVDSITEAIRLRQDGIKVPILVLGYTLPERVHEAIENNISLTISNFESLEGWVSLGLTQKITIHIKVDT